MGVIDGVWVAVEVCVAEGVKLGDAVMVAVNVLVFGRNGVLVTVAVGLAVGVSVAVPVTGTVGVAVAVSGVLVALAVNAVSVSVGVAVSVPPSSGAKERAINPMQ